MRAAGIVLAGGRSSRMGQSKAWLAWHGSTLLHRTAALLGRSVAGPVVVVCAPGQELPALPAGVQVVADPVEGLGPLRGVGTGLAAVAGQADAAFVCATDTPFLHPAYVRCVLRCLAESGSELLLPVAAGYRQPLAAGYRTVLAGRIDELLAGGASRLGALPGHCTVTTLDDAGLLADGELARHDPELASLRNVNTPGEYAAATREPAPWITVGDQRVRAGTLGAVGPVRAGWVALLNGEPSTDPLTPLVAGDTVTFRQLRSG